jgi:hypothetical protein
MMLHPSAAIRLIISGVTFFLLFQRPLQAGVTVYPTFLFLNSPNRAASLVVTNNSSVAAEIWIDFRYGYPLGDDSGNIYMKFFDSTDDSEPSAVSWLRAFPQRFVLEPQESQKIRILVSPPAGISSKEYWARVIIHSKDKETTPVGNQRGQIRTGIKLMTNVDVPFHYRNGRVSTGVIFQNVEVQAQPGMVKIVTDLARTGNASYWGIYKVVLRDSRGKIVTTKDQNIAVYQNLRYVMPVDLSKVPSGTYTLELEISSQRRDIRQEFLLVSEPLRRNITITIP